jgi:hypothetical protein
VLAFHRIDGLIDAHRTAALYTLGEQTSSPNQSTVIPLDAAWIEDLGPGDFVKAECMACGHDELIPASALLQGLRLPPTYRVLDLEPRLRCRECDTRGKAAVSIKWGEPAA